MLFKIFRSLVCFILKIWFNYKVLGTENIPRKGPIIIASNHMSHLDPVVVGIAIPYLIRSMAKEELFKIPIFKWLIIILGAFPIERRKIKSAIKKSLELLQAGQTVLLFPEGTRSKTGQLNKWFLGIGMIAYKSKVDIIPTCIIGTDKVLPVKGLFPRPYPITIKFGKPIKVKEFLLVSPPKEIFKNIAERVIQKIKELQRENASY